MFIVIFESVNFPLFIVRLWVLLLNLSAPVKIPEICKSMNRSCLFGLSDMKMKNNGEERTT